MNPLIGTLSTWPHPNLLFLKATSKYHHTGDQGFNNTNLGGEDVNILYMGGGDFLIIIQQLIQEAASNSKHIEILNF